MFIGGAAVAGGVGTVVGSMIGGLVMGVLNLGLANMSVDSNWIQIIKGLVLLGAVAFDVLSKARGGNSFVGMVMKAFQGRASQMAGESGSLAVGAGGMADTTAKPPVSESIDGQGDTQK